MALNFSDLQYFRAIVEHGSISKAAKALRLKQPSLSQSLKRLELELDVQLFIRTSKGVSLSRPGVRLFSHANELFQMWLATSKAVKESAFEVAGNFSLGCYSSVGVLTFPMFLPQLIRKYPQVRMHIEHKTSQEITQDVVSSKLDIGLVVNPIRHPNLIMLELYTDVVGLWKSKHDTTENTPNSDQSVLIADKRLATSAWLHQELAKNALNFANVIDTDSLEVICNLVASGAGIGILPRSIALLWKELALIPLKEVTGFKDRMYLIYRQENRMHHPMRIIVKFICEAIKSGMKDAAAH